MPILRIKFKGGVMLISTSQPRAVAAIGGTTAYASLSGAPDGTTAAIQLVLLQPEVFLVMQQLLQCKQERWQQYLSTSFLHCSLYCSTADVSLPGVRAIVLLLTPVLLVLQFVILLTTVPWRISDTKVGDNSSYVVDFFKGLILTSLTEKQGQHQSLASFIHEMDKKRSTCLPTVIWYHLKRC